MSLVIDNGGGTIKAGFDTFSKPLVVANMTARVSKSMQYLVSEQINDCRNGSSLNFIRPFDRGYLNNWQCEIDIWSYLLSLPDFQGIAVHDTGLILTEPPVNPTTTQNDYNEVVFEHFGFKEYTRRPATSFSMYEFSQDSNRNKNNLNSCLVVDSGFSFTHTVPFVDGNCQKHAVRVIYLFYTEVHSDSYSNLVQVRRLNIGGKLLTNYLKELVSYRQWNMMDEYLLMNQVRLKHCSQFYISI